ncbi:MAG: solute carrier 35 member [Caeruleum heppii]|nr:MAG: solute carrier 35 member [Caeruleum heppii]
MAIEEKERVSGELTRAPAEPSPVLPTVNPALEKSEPSKPALHPSVYVIAWISLSSSVILFNKWILHTKEFDFPVILTTWHLGFATLMTQILARTTTLLDGRKTVKMTGRVYLRAIVPIGFFFSLSLICGNLTYLYLSVAFIQMLKATTPVAVLLASWSLGVSQPNMKVLFNVSFIVIGVVIASFGELQFVLIGFIFQVGGIAFEAVRLVMVQRLLSSAEYKMDPLVSLYYFAPVCTVMNLTVSLFMEIPRLTMGDIYKVGLFTLLANAMVAFALNVSVVFLIGKTSSLVLTLCGVLKDILLVAASMMIWQTPVSGLQFFGYSIALGGLMYYKLGADQLKGYLSHGGQMWAEYGSKHPAMRKAIVFGVVLVILFLFLGGLAPRYAPNIDTLAYLQKTRNSLLGHNPV